MKNIKLICIIFAFLVILSGCANNNEIVIKNDHINITNISDVLIEGGFKDSTILRMNIIVGDGSILAFDGNIYSNNNFYNFITDNESIVFTKDQGIISATLDKDLYYSSEELTKVLLSINCFIAKEYELFNYSIKAFSGNSNIKIDSEDVIIYSVRNEEFYLEDYMEKVTQKCFMIYGENKVIYILFE